MIRVRVCPRADREPSKIRTHSHEGWHSRKEINEVMEQKPQVDRGFLRVELRGFEPLTP